MSLLRRRLPYARIASWVSTLAAMLCGVLLLSHILTAASSGKPFFLEDPNVEELTSEDFEARVLQDNHTWVVNFYADWCPHCKHYASTYRRLAASMRDEVGVRFGALDCAGHVMFCNSFDVEGYPTIRGYHFPDLKNSYTRQGGHISKEARSESSFPAWIREHLKLKTAAAQQTEEEGSGSTRAETAAAAKGDDESLASTAWADARVALLFYLRQGSLLHTNHGGEGVRLDGEPLAELCKWLEFLSAILPSSEAQRDVRSLADVPCHAQRGPGYLEGEAWLKVLDSKGIAGIPARAGLDPTPFWRSCVTSTCGLWRLFHIAAASAAAAAATVQPVAEAEPKIFLGTASATSPGTVLERIRGFVKHFFGCQECVTHFLEIYDSCSLGRCALQPGDQEGPALWLWQVHNNVTKRIAAEQGVKVPPAWPPRSLCQACWPSPADGGEEWDRPAVVQFLKTSYLPQASELDVASSSGGGGFLLLLCGLGVSFLLVCLAWQIAGTIQNFDREKGN